MDRLDLQSAGCFERARKQRPGRAQVRVVQQGFHAKRFQNRPQRGVIQHRPFPKALEQTVLHLARRRFGVGEAEDLLRLYPVQQQARHTIRQNAGFA